MGVCVCVCICFLIRKKLCIQWPVQVTKSHAAPSPPADSSLGSWGRSCRCAHQHLAVNFRFINMIADAHTHFTYCTWFSLSLSSVQEAAFFCSLFTSETSLMMVSLLAFASISWTFTVSSRVTICLRTKAFSSHSSLSWRESSYS